MKIQNKIDQVKSDMFNAMSNKDSEIVNALRLVQSKAQMIALKERNDKVITEEDMTIALRQCIKMTDEEINIYSKIQTPKGINMHKNALEAKALYELYLPSDYSKEEVERMIDMIIKDAELSTIKDMGRVMKCLKQVSINENKGYDGKAASEYVRKCLT